MIVRDRAFIGNGVSVTLLKGVLAEFAERKQTLQQLRDYYDGKHAILQRQKLRGSSNEKLVINHAKYITDMASAYMVGGTIGYADEEQAAALAPLTEAYKRCNIDSIDTELAKLASMLGVALEVMYMSRRAEPRVATIDPLSAFVVYDNTVENAPLFGVQEVALTDESGKVTGTRITVCTDSYYQYFERRAGAAEPIPAGEPEAHYFGEVPLTEYWNNAEERGDFAPVLSLIDAYNLMMSDRINDKVQLVEAILVVMGASLGDTDAEFAKQAKQMREQGILELSADGDAKYLTKQLSEADVQVLADALASDIHKIAMVPAMTDEQFAGNASGVALAYKLLGLENLTRTKESWFKEGLCCRLRLFASILHKLGHPQLDPEAVQITFVRGLPVNDLEQAQIVGLLDGKVPDELLLKQLRFVDDVGKALEMLAEQKKQRSQQQAALFGGYPDANEAGDKGKKRLDEPGGHAGHGEDARA